MQLSETLKLHPTEQQREIILHTMAEYIDTVNSLVSYAVSGNSISKTTTADVSADLPSALTNQCIRDANSIVNKYSKACRKAEFKNRKLAKRGSAIKVPDPHVPVLKKLCCYINNQNYKINDKCLEIPVMINGKSKRISVAIKFGKRQDKSFLSNRLGTMRIVMKNHTIAAQIVYDSVESKPQAIGGVMGVDLGIKCPAVSYCSDRSVKFYGNGRKNKYIRRHYNHLRKKLQKAKKRRAVKRIGDKEQRVMRDIDHKISREIVNTAIAHNVKIIKLEQLQNVRSATRKSRKNNHSLHNWSFYRLAQFIEYKAKLAGISVEYVNPAYTSQTCYNFDRVKEE